MGVGDAHLAAIGKLTQLQHVTVKVSYTEEGGLCGSKQHAAAAAHVCTQCCVPRMCPLRMHSTHLTLLLPLPLLSLVCFPLARQPTQVCPRETTPAGLCSLTALGLLDSLQHLALYDAELPCETLSQHLSGASLLTSLQFGLSSVSRELSALRSLPNLKVCLYGCLSGEYQKQKALHKMQLCTRKVSTSTFLTSTLLNRAMQPLLPPPCAAGSLCLLMYACSCTTH